MLEPTAAIELASEALVVAVRVADPDLELRALAQLGMAEVSRGEVDEGLAHLDEAMAAATSGEPTTLETFADVCCTLMQACELAGDDERPKQWGQVFESFVRKYDHVPLLAFCRTCGADVSAANGRIDAAEQELLAALRELREAGQRQANLRPYPISGSRARVKPVPPTSHHAKDAIESDGRAARVQPTCKSTR